MILACRQPIFVSWGIFLWIFSRHEIRSSMHVDWKLIKWRVTFTKKVLYFLQFWKLARKEEALKIQWIKSGLKVLSWDEIKINSNTDLKSTFFQPTVTVAVSTIFHQMFSSIWNSNDILSKNTIICSVFILIVYPMVWIIGCKK